MDELARISFLLDFYGGLLNERQYAILSMHCNEDQSLTEISEALGITRQGVCDSICKGKEKLERYEEKLGLAGKFLTEREKLSVLLKSIESLEENEMSSHVSDTVKRIKTDIQNMLGDL